MIRRLLTRFAIPRPGSSPVPDPTVDPDTMYDDAMRAHLIRTIGHRIATEAAAREIETHALCLWQADGGPGMWYDSSITRPGHEMSEHAVSRATTFLGLCGLIERVPLNPHLVRIKGESMPL